MNRLYETIGEFLLRYLSVFFLAIVFLLIGDLKPADATNRSDELVASGSGRMTIGQLSHYGVVGQIPSLGMEGNSGGLRLLSGNLVTFTGIGAFSEKDSDGDGTFDEADAFPLNPQEDTDTDGDGTGNNADADDDNDGTIDDADAFPLNPYEIADRDGDGIGDNADADNDNDGIGDAEEAAHPNGGDGNNDGVADSLQNRVASFISVNAFGYITIESPEGTYLANCRALGNPDPQTEPDGISFLYGFFGSSIHGIEPGGSTTLKIHYSSAFADFHTFFQYGPTPDDLNPHWYAYDNEEAPDAIVDNEAKTVTLHLLDAQSGDEAMEEDGTIVIGHGGVGTRSVDDDPDSGGCFIDMLEKRFE